MEGEEGVVKIMGRTEIDTRAPFKSVKEAVMLFGERVLVGEIYANKLNEMRVNKESETGNAQSRVGAMAAELEEAKQSLQKAIEETNFMAQCIKSLKRELEQTKKELEDTKVREIMLLQRKDNPEIEDLKFINANATKEEMETTQTDEDDQEFQKRRYVKFASPHALAHVIPNKDELLERHSSVKKDKRKQKQLMPLIGWLFSKKKGSLAVDSPRAQGAISSP